MKRTFKPVKKAYQPVVEDNNANARKHPKKSFIIPPHLVAIQIDTIEKYNKFMGIEDDNS
jgi:hypothetical protein